MKSTMCTSACGDRRYFIGGSDARIIRGDDEGALLRLWREKRGEIEREDVSGNLIVQLGSATEELNRHWYERNTGQVVTEVQRQVFHPVKRWMAATLDGMPSTFTTALPTTAPCSGAVAAHVVSIVNC